MYIPFTLLPIFFLNSSLYENPALNDTTNGTTAVDGQFETILIAEAEKIANNLQSLIGDDREMTQRLQYELLDQTASLEEKKYSMEKIFTAYRPEDKWDPKAFVSELIESFEKQLKELEKLIGDGNWAKETFVRIGRIALEERFIEATSEERKKVVEAVIKEERMKRSL